MSHFAFLSTDHTRWALAALESSRSVEQRMAVLIECSERSIADGNGGPFAAAVFDGDGRPIAVGHNSVLAHDCALWHAELSAIAVASDRLQAPVFPAGTVLLSTAAPCVMCLGAIWWSRPSRLVYAATRADVEAIGFDEGPVAPDWETRAEQRGIRCEGGVLREAAARVLRVYEERGGLLY